MLGLALAGPLTLGDPLVVLIIECGTVGVESEPGMESQIAVLP